MKASIITVSARGAATDGIIIIMVVMVIVVVAAAVVVHVLFCLFVFTRLVVGFKYFMK